MTPRQSSRRQHGGFLMGMIVGLLVGLGAALAVVPHRHQVHPLSGAEPEARQVACADETYPPLA